MMWKKIKFVWINVAHTLLRVWWFVRRPQSAGVKVVLISQGTVLLVRHNYGHRRWTLPGGGRKRREAPSIAAQREVQEELGLTLSTLHPCGAYDTTYEHKKVHVECFYAEMSEQMAVEIDDFEIAEARWWSLGALPNSRALSVDQIIKLYESSKHQ